MRGIHRGIRTMLRIVVWISRSIQERYGFRGILNTIGSPGCKSQQSNYPEGEITRTNEAMQTAAAAACRECIHTRSHPITSHRLSPFPPVWRFLWCAGRLFFHHAQPPFVSETGQKKETVNIHNDQIHDINSKDNPSRGGWEKPHEFLFLVNQAVQLTLHP